MRPLNWLRKKTAKAKTKTPEGINWAAAGLPEATIKKHRKFIERSSNATPEALERIVEVNLAAAKGKPGEPPIKGRETLLARAGIARLMADYKRQDKHQKI